MNILAFLELYFLKNKSGGEKYIYDILKKISEKNKVSVLCDGDDEPIKYDDINVYETNKKLPSEPRLIWSSRIFEF